MKDLPKLKITIDEEYSEGEDLGISQIAFTSRPAIITKGFAFNAQEPIKKFFSDDLKYRICAPAMIPMEIYRFSDEDGEYMVEFTVEEIDKIHQKFMSQIKTKDVFNLEHDSTKSIPAFILEAWIVEDPKTDKAFTKFGIDVPQGTLMLTSQLTDQDVYRELVDEGRVGYSIEGFLGLKLSEIKQKINTQMENKLDLPAGEYPVGEDKILVVAEDGTFEIKIKEVVVEEEMAAMTPEEEAAKIAEEEAKMAEGDPVVEPDAVVEPVVEVAPSYTKEEIDAKFEELYKLIADMKAEEEIEDADEIIVAPTALSVHDRFAEFVRFSRGV